MQRMPPSQYRRETRKILKYVLSQRIKSLGLLSLFKTLKPCSNRIVYIDAGTHKHARELNLVIKWFSHLPRIQFFGFEAHPEYLEEAQSSLFETSKDSKMVNLALVGPDDGDSIVLNLDGGDGLGNSVFRKATDRSITVPSVRLSTFLNEIGVVPERDIIILRMNIEGAEVLVLKDLADARILRKIDGYFGSWDDVRKIGGGAV